MKTTIPKIDAIALIETRKGVWNVDPDAPGEPRLDDDGVSIVSQAAQTRGVRDMIMEMVALGQLPADRYGIQIRRGEPVAGLVEEAVARSDPRAREILDAAVREREARRAAEAETANTEEETNGKRKRKRKGRNGKHQGSQLESREKYPEDQIRAALCSAFADNRWFGNVNTSKVFRSHGIRGAIQIGMAESVGPVQVVPITGTRMAPDNDAEGRGREFTHRSVIPYALYTCAIHIGAMAGTQNGMDADDLKAFFRAYTKMFDNVFRSSQRGTITLKDMFLCKHREPLGSISMARFADRVTLQAPDGWPREYADFQVKFYDSDPPEGATFFRLSDVEENLDAIVGLG